MALRTKVSFYYDTLSPYAWFGFEILSRYQNIWNLDLDMKPLNVKRVMVDSKNVSPTTIQYKKDMMLKDTRRIADMMCLPFNTDSYSLSNMERGSTACMKTLAACKLLHPEHIQQLSREAWLGLYQRNIDITDTDNIRQFCEAAGVPDVDKLLEFSQGPEAREEYIGNTQEALALKAFGVPWITVTNPVSGETEAMFGQDRIEVLGWILGKKYQGYSPQ